jgi:hypothetical protein
MQQCVAAGCGGCSVMQQPCNTPPESDGKTRFFYPLVASVPRLFPPHFPSAAWALLGVIRSEVEGREMYRDVSGRAPALRPGRWERCIVVVFDDRDEAEAIDRELSQVNSSRLRAYEDLWRLLEHPPCEDVAAVILATRDDPETIGQTLQWARHRWPRCLVTVIGDVGGEGHEMAARENSANFLTRPVTSVQWRAVVRHAIGREQSLEGGSSPERAGPLTRGLLSGRPVVGVEPAAARSRLEPPANVRNV